MSSTPLSNNPLINAIQYSGTKDSERLVIDWLNGRYITEPTAPKKGHNSITLEAPGATQTLHLNPGDWVIREAENNYRTLTQAEFAAEVDEIPPDTPVAWVHNDTTILVINASNYVELARAIAKAPDVTKLASVITPDTPTPSIRRVMQQLMQSQPSSYFLPEVLLQEPHWEHRHMIPTQLTAPDQWGYVKITFIPATTQEAHHASSNRIPKHA